MPYIFQCLVYLWYFFASINTANIVADQVQPFILTVHCFSKGFSGKIMCHCLKMVARKLLYFTPMVCTVPRSQPNKTLLGWGEVGCSQPSRHWKTAKTTLSSQYRSKSLWNISGTSLNRCLEKKKKFWLFQGSKSGLHCNTKVYLIKLSMSVFTILVKDYTSVRDLRLKYSFPSLAS